MVLLSVGVGLLYDSEAPHVLCSLSPHPDSAEQQQPRVERDVSLPHPQPRQGQTQQQSFCVSTRESRTCHDLHGWEDGAEVARCLHKEKRAYHYVTVLCILARIKINAWNGLNWKCIFNKPQAFVGNPWCMIYDKCMMYDKCTYCFTNVKCVKKWPTANENCIYCNLYSRGT